MIFFQLSEGGFFLRDFFFFGCFFFIDGGFPWRTVQKFFVRVVKREKLISKNCLLPLKTYRIRIVPGSFSWDILLLGRQDSLRSFWEHFPGRCSLLFSGFLSGSHGDRSICHPFHRPNLIIKTSNNNDNNDNNDRDRTDKKKNSNKRNNGSGSKISVFYLDITFTIIQ